MYKMLSVLLCCLISGSVFANTCIDEINQHAGINNLELSSCHLQDQDIPHVAAFITNHPSIYSLYISDNQIGPEGAAVIAGLSNLEVLIINNNNIGDEGAVALSKTKSIMLLEMGHNNITGVGVKALAQSNVIHVLSLSGNNLNDNDLVGLTNNKSLNMLYIENNNIGPNGAAVFAKMPALKYLFITSNPIGNKGVIEIAKNSNLDVLDAKSCAITAEGARALSKLPNLNLYALDLSYNLLGDNGAAALAQLKIGGALFLDATEMYDEGAIALANLTFTEPEGLLSLSKNHIYNEGAFALAKSKVYVLDVTYNHIGQAGIDALMTSGIAEVWTDGNYGPGIKRLKKNKYENRICKEKDIKNCYASLLKKMKENKKL